MVRRKKVLGRRSNSTLREKWEDDKEEEQGDDGDDEDEA